MEQNGSNSMWATVAAAAMSSAATYALLRYIDRHRTGSVLLESLNSYKDRTTQYENPAYLQSPEKTLLGFQNNSNAPHKRADPYDPRPRSEYVTSALCV
jgi:hypothetical protein